MITLHDLDTAIAKCQGLADPKPADAIKLAAFYIIKNEMYGQQPEPSTVVSAPAYSYAAAPEIAGKQSNYSGAEPEAVGEYGNSDFLQAIAGKDPAAMWAIMDELMDTLLMVNKRVYDGVMRRIH